MLEQLPVEVLEKVMGFLPACEASFGVCRRASIRQLLGVCSSLHGLARPLLYSELALGHEEAMKFIATKQDQPEMASFVRQLRLRTADWTADTLHQVLAGLDKLETLQIDGIDYVQVCTLHTMPRLTSLSLSYKQQTTSNSSTDPAQLIQDIETLAPNALRVELVDCTHKVLMPASTRHIRLIRSSECARTIDGFADVAAIQSLAVIQCKSSSDILEHFATATLPALRDFELDATVAASYYEPLRLDSTGTLDAARSRDTEILCNDRSAVVDKIVTKLPALERLKLIGDGSCSPRLPRVLSLTNPSLRHLEISKTACNMTDLLHLVQDAPSLRSLHLDHSESEVVRELWSAATQRDINLSGSAFAALQSRVEWAEHVASSSPTSARTFKRPVRSRQGER